MRGAPAAEVQAWQEQKELERFAAEEAENDQRIKGMLRELDRHEDELGA